MDLSGLGEFGLIGLIRERFASIPSHGCEGIGDDCAVLPLNTGSAGGLFIQPLRYKIAQ